jgi:ATP-dependent Clp protease ATP-binding subunit ClpB
LDHLRNRLEANDFGMEVSDAALELLAEAGFDPVYGARPLKRAIQTEIENPLAQKILSGDLTPGTTIRIDVENGRFIFL